MVYLNETFPEETEDNTNATKDIGVITFNISTGVTTATIASDTQLLYFAGAIAVGVMGFIANGVVFSLLCLQRNSGKNIILCNDLIHNQTVIDFSASVFLIIMYAVKIHGVYMTGTLGRFYCKLLDSNAMFGLGINASTAGLMVISVERYAKIVHSVFYRVHFRQWMKYIGLVFPWIYSVLISFPFLMVTSDISNGKCLPLTYWSASWLREFYGIGTFIWKFLLPLAIFFFCYTKILLLIKEQSKVHESHSTNNHGHNLLSRSEKNIVKTLLFVVGCFVVSYSPFFFYLLFSVLQMNCCHVQSNTYFIAVWISYLNIVINPFIYATKSDIVQKLIRRMGKRKHHTEQAMSTASPYTIEN